MWAYSLVVGPAITFGGQQTILCPRSEQFVEELVARSKRDAAAKPGFTRRLPPLPRPKEPGG
jgi:hypothetical protein